MTTGDTLSNGEPSKEFKVWKLIYNIQNPTRKDFFIRTTPIGISPEVQFNYGIRNFTLGTTVVMDTVLRNLGSRDNKGYNTVDTNFFLQGYNYYYSFPPIDTSMAQNSKGNTFCTPAHFYIDGNNNTIYGIKITAESGDTLILKQNKKLWISGHRFITPNQGDTLLFKSGSTLIKDPSAEIFQCFGGRLIFESGASSVWSIHSCQAAMAGGAIEYLSGSHTVKDSGFIAIGNGGTLRLGNNVTLTFDGGASPLILMPGSQVICGSNSKIEFKNGAHLRANGSTFSCPNGSWQGITLANSTYDTIKNCTFSNASTYIDMSLNSSTSNIKKIITGNTFNSGKVKIHNSYNVLISNDTFNSPSATPYLLQMSANLGNESESVANLNITGNVFKGGSVQMDLDGYASSVSKYYIEGNTFYGLTSGYSVCLLANKISGDFKNNTFADNHFSTGIQLINSNLNFLNNVVKTYTNNNIYILTSSTGNLAPVVINEQGGLAYVGGYNKMYLDNIATGGFTYANVNFALGNYFYGKDGHNCFNINDITPNYNVWGDQGAPCIEDPVYITGNNWLPATPKITITCTGGTATVITGTNESCMELEDLSAAEYVVTYKGDGIYDSVKVVYPSESAAPPPQVQTDKLLFGKTLISNRRGDYYTAIEKAKELVNNHGSSQYLYSALDELYMAYKGMDTSSSGTNSLFGELQSYIEAKMQQYQNNLYFTDKAYNIYLMCLVKRKQYSEAIAGYENIMNNHPDPVARLAASWDRSAVVLLMGQSGSFSNKISSPSEWVRVRRLSDRNPDKIARKMYKFANAESENGTLSEKYTPEEKSLIYDRAGKFNPSTKAEFEEKVSQDKALLLGLNKDASENNKDINIPKRFTLRQNYPNPFNPTTTIKYDIPKDAFISLKVYDVLGREVFSVNEFKKAGSYETLFDGSGFASGVYFYSLEANGLKETKKMLMVK